MIDLSQTREEDESYENVIDEMFKELEKKDPEHFAARQYAKYNISTLNVLVASEIMGIPLRDHVIVAGGTGSIYSYRAELKDNFSIEGLQELLGIKDKRALVNEKAADYKPLAKIEELEEENYNQIDNYLSNTISPAEEKRQRILRSEVRRVAALSGVAARHFL